MIKYSSDLINSFYTELFSTDIRNYDTPVQNAKTDLLLEVNSFDDWFDGLVEMFCKETNCDKSQLKKDIKNCGQFVKDMKEEYDELQEDWED